jgi:ribosomal protein S18 acetylase RimI-like enzyme
MCFGQSDSEGEGEQMTTSGKMQEDKPKLKRRRSPTKANDTQLQDPRKLSKLDSAASTLAASHHIPFEELQDPRKPSKLGSSPSNLTDRQSKPFGELPSPQRLQKRNSWSSTRTLDPCIGTGDETSIEHHAASLESANYNACEGQDSYGFKDSVGRLLYPALRFQFLRSTKLTNDELAACFDLISTTSQEDYKASSMGWHPTEKMKEMKDNEMMYLLVRQEQGFLGMDKVEQSGEQGPTGWPVSSNYHKSTDKAPYIASPPKRYTGAILGFLSFMFCFDDPPYEARQVLYIYEIHLDDRLRGQGLGGRMIKWVESQARLVKVTKVMLTVFTSNESARKLYERLGFVKDECSPDDRVTRRKTIKADYIIMSKEI